MNTRDGKVCLIYTGGTIGMVADKEGVLRPPTDPRDFLKLAPELENIVDFDFVPLLNKDSTNIVPSDWSLMARRIYERRNHGYAGFVIAHGTDTMHFSASALAFALGRSLNFPVVLTGAQTTQSVHHGDARINLLRAMRVAMEDLAEVVISFGHHIFRGCRTQKRDERRFDAFESPWLYPIGDITEEILLHPTAVKRNHPEVGNIDLKPEFVDEILQVTLIPGLQPKLLEPVLERRGCKGIVLQSFGAGNVPDGGDIESDRTMYGFGDFIQKAVGNEIPVVITSQFPANSTLRTRYAPGLAAVAAGAIPTGNMTSAAATVKFRWVLARVQQEINKGDTRSSRYMARIRDLMDQNYVREMD